MRVLLILIFGLSLAFGEKTKEENKAPDRSAEEKSAAEKTARDKTAGEKTAAEKPAGGKSGEYRQTPFGVVKASEDARPAPPAPDVRVIDQGDSYKFERSTPFGLSKWTRKKSELTRDEQEIVDKANSRSSANAGTKE